MEQDNLPVDESFDSKYRQFFASEGKEKLVFAYYELDQILIKKLPLAPFFFNNEKHQLTIEDAVLLVKALKKFAPQKITQLGDWQFLLQSSHP